MRVPGVVNWYTVHELVLIASSERSDADRRASARESGCDSGGDGVRARAIEADHCEDRLAGAAEVGRSGGGGQGLASGRGLFWRRRGEAVLHRQTPGLEEVVRVIRRVPDRLDHQRLTASLL